MPAQAEILIGVAGPLSGPNAAYGNELRVGAAAAVAAINASGGINGETLAIVEGDDACDSKRAIDIAKNFVSRDVRMVVGHFCTSASLAAAPTYNAAGILMFNPAVTSPELTSKNLWNVFRATGRDDRQGELAATRMKSEGIGGDAIMITDDLAETAKLAKGFADALPDAKVITIKSGSAKLPDEPGLIIASAFYLALQANDAADVTKSLRKLNTSARILGPDTLQSEAFGTRAEADANGVLVSFLRDNATIANPTTLSKLPQSEGATLAAYASVEVFAIAAKATNVNDGRAMATWLTNGNDAQTIIGKLGFNASGDLKQQPYVWYTWTAGALVPESP
jgi:branched-chain amino acid transport system substrate-binding protein